MKVAVADGGARGARSPPPQLFWIKPKKCFLEPPPPQPYLRVWVTIPPPALSQGLDPALSCLR